jgi:predicted RNA-binding Zn ribbon-like protein
MTTNTELSFSTSPAGRFLFLGGRLAVDFANSILASSGGDGALKDWEGLVAFLQQAGIVSGRRAGELHRLEQSDLGAVDALLQRALRLRESLREAFAARVEGNSVERVLVEPVNQLLRITEGHDELVQEQGEWKLQFIAREGSLEWLLAAIARSAAEILAEGADAPLRKCANPNCVLYFYDTSRTGQRRWCSMAVCGNRSKVAAFSRRHTPRRKTTSA